MNRFAATTLGTVTLGLSLTFLAACNEENVLYSYDSPDPIPEAPTAPQPPPAMAAGSAVPPSAAGPMLPTPDAMPFASAPRGSETTPVPVKGVILAIPKRWKSTPSPSEMRAAQYEVPSEHDGAPAGEFVAFSFGPGQGGSMRENAQRWLGQFTPEKGALSPVQSFQTSKVGPLTVTRLVLAGTYAPAPMMAGQPTDKREGWGLDGLVVEGGPMGTLFLRLTGSVDIMEHEARLMENMAATATLEDPSGAVASATPAASTAAIPGTADTVAIVEAPGVRFRVPGDWESSPPTSSMRALQFTMPGGAEGVLFYFGPNGGGTAADNVARWAGQITGVDGKPGDASAAKTTKVGQFTVTQIELTGTWSGGAMAPNAPKPEPKAGSALTGIVIEGGSQGALYFRITGPQAVVEGLRPAVADLLASLEAM